MVDDAAIARLTDCLVIAANRNITVEQAIAIHLANRRADQRLGDAFPEVPYWAKGGDIRRKRVAKGRNWRGLDKPKPTRKVKRDPQVWRVSKRQRLLSTNQVLSEGTKI